MDFDDFDTMRNDNDIDEMEDFTEISGFMPPSFCPYRQLPPQTPPGPPPMGGGAGGPQPHQGPPSGPPPSFTPKQQQYQPKAVDPRAIRRCMYRYSYIRLNNGSSFWAWITFVGRTSIAGWRWNGRRWVYFGIDLRRIASFVCY